MKKQKVVNVEVGSQVKIGGRVYAVTKKVIHFGGFGDYVSMSLYDIERDFWVKDQTFQQDTQVNVVKVA